MTESEIIGLIVVGLIIVLFVAIFVM